jgi:chloride channel protein, CIC family
MGAVFAAAAQAPMTAVLILFELTGDYRIILPLMLTVVVATLLARKMMRKQSVYTLKLARRGVNLRYGRDVDVLQGVQVSEVMRTEIDTLDHDLSIEGFSESLGRKRHQGFPILDEEGKLWGIVTVSDLENAVRLRRPKETIVKDIGTPFEDLVLAYPDESIGDVLIKMGPRGLGRIPVVSRDDPHQLIGVIGRQDTIRAYNIAMVRRSELGQRIERTQRERSQGMEYLELALHKTDRAVGKHISELASNLPEDCIIVSIHRNSKVIIPHGHTVLREGDVITVYTRSDLIQELHRSFE